MSPTRRPDVRPIEAVAISAARQRNAVSEGMALGLVMNECSVVPYKKGQIDVAFEQAWQGWPDEYKAQFRQVTADLRRGIDGMWVMTHAGHRRKTSVFYWSFSPATIDVRGRHYDWDGRDPADLDYAVTTIEGAVPLCGWKSLAAAFLTELRK